MYDIRKLACRLVLFVVLTGLGSAFAQSFEVMMTAYSSEVAQTDATPTITSTGERVRSGIVAVSRDLLQTELPYGTRLRVVEVKPDARSCGGWVPGTLLEVQDTLHPRKTNQIDLWVPDRQQALEWGRCRVVVEVVSTPA